MDATNTLGKEGFASVLRRAMPRTVRLKREIKKEDDNNNVVMKQEKGYKIPDWRKYFWDQEIDRCLEFVHVPRNLFICPNKSVEIVWKLKRKVRFSRIVKEKMMEQFHSGIDKIYLPIVWTFTNKNLHHMSCFLIDCRRKLIIYTDISKAQEREQYLGHCSITKWIRKNFIPKSNNNEVLPTEDLIPFSFKYIRTPKLGVWYYKDAYQAYQIWLLHLFAVYEEFPDQLTHFPHKSEILPIIKQIKRANMLHPPVFPKYEKAHSPSSIEQPSN